MIVLIAFLLRGAAQGQFQRGHIFVAVTEPESCDFGGREWIIEVDPVTGAWSVFADSDDGICVVSGLRFMPDGSRLLAANAGHIIMFNDGGWIQAFNPDGSSEIILDASDALDQPYGNNALAFDKDKNLYIVNAGNSRILRFPSDGGPATVFADRFDGINDRGALDFASNGDLFYAGDLAGAIIRFSPMGNSFIFHDRGARAMSIAPAGHLYIAGGGQVWEFDIANPGPHRVVSTNFLGDMAVAPSPHPWFIYVADALPGIHRLNRVNGTTLRLATFPGLSTQLLYVTGMTVIYPDSVADANGDGDVDLMDFALLQRCWFSEAKLELAPVCQGADIDQDAVVARDDHKILVQEMGGP